MILLICSVFCEHCYGNKPERVAVVEKHNILHFQVTGPNLVHLATGQKLLLLENSEELS